MNKLKYWLIATVVAILIFTWCTSNNETYVVNYTAYKYDLLNGELLENDSKTCRITINGYKSKSAVKEGQIINDRIKYAVWDYELSNSRNIIADSIHINSIQKIK